MPRAGTAPAAGVVASLASITKRFGRVVACDDVTLSLRAGEIHGLLGENGAGKSTLMRVLAGFLVPDEGEVVVGGDSIRLGDTAASAAHGVGMVHQHDSLIGALTVWENLELTGSGRPNRAEVVADLAVIEARYGLVVNPDARVATLAPSQRQRVELAKCLRREPRILVLDEPTSSLTPDESRALFKALRDITMASGLAIVLISHRLEEIMDATDLVTVMRKGRIVHEQATRECTPGMLAEAMVGRPVDLQAEAAAVGAVSLTVRDDRTAAEPAWPTLRLVDVSARSPISGESLVGATFSVGKGEVVGVVGVEGNGQRTLADLLSGHLNAEAGVVEVWGRPVDLSRPGALRAAGISVISDDRQRDACALSLSVAENLVLDCSVGPGAERLLSRRQLRRLAAHRAALYGISGAALDAPMSALSGGNQQRVVLARELSRSPFVIVAAQPTRGLDVGATEDVYRRLGEATRSGVAVLLISSDLDEVLALSHRIVVLFRGSVVADQERPASLDARRLGLLMATGLARP